jgi:two-component system sensor histidine kinase/response regulator
MLMRTAISKLMSLFDHKRFKFLFIKPINKIAVDLGVYILINVVTISVLLLLTDDSTVAMIGAVWVGIIAWRGGVMAGVLGALFMTISDYFPMNPPLHAKIPIEYYFNNKVPGFVIGISQSLIVGIVVGYISTLIHQLREEINLRKKIQTELEQKIAELDAFNRTVAHDLKNPLMVINASVDLLISESVSSENVMTSKLLSFINNGTKNMINIIESILTLAGVKKIDHKEFAVFPISQSVNEALKRMEYSIESNKVYIRKPDNWPSVFGHAPWITQVWVNYIHNAIKYGGNISSQIKPVVELGYDKLENSGQIRFWVKDNGEGIQKDKVGTLFKEFTRLHTGETEGHGLGLSIVKSVIEKFNGVVGVESEPGNGSLFYFTLPSKRPENN